jgi:anti-sigma-K factor RskA
MSAQGEQLTDFECRSRLVLEESVLRIDGRVRSRLNQARQAAVEAASAKRRPMFWRVFTLVPTAGAVAAALLVAIVLWYRAPDREPPLVVAGITDTHPVDLDLMSDGEGLDLVQDGDGSGSFYEWAADQSEANGNETDT